MDLVGPLPISAAGFRFNLMIVDCTTHWSEAVPICTVEVTMCVEAFIASRVARFGVQSMLTTGQVWLFTSAVWSRLCQLLSVEHINTTAYHLQSNGIVELAHKQHKDML